MFKRTIERELKENRYLIENIENPVIKKYCEEQLNWYTRKAIFNKYSYYIFTIITIICPIISGVILVLPIDGDGIKVISEVVLGLSAFFAAMIPVFDCRRKWGIYRNEAEMIKSFLIDYNLEGDTEQLMKKMESSKQNTHENWYQRFQEDNIKRFEDGKEKKRNHELRRKQESNGRAKEKRRGRGILCTKWRIARSVCQSKRSWRNMHVAREVQSVIRFCGMHGVIISIG